ncbi:uncharacterized protein LOC100373430 [Saccoglossus kowalevskii]
MEFTRPEFHQLEVHTVFHDAWMFAGRVDQITKPGKFFTGTIGKEPYIVLRDENNELKAFYNVCRHHAMQIVNDTEGTVKDLQCPYHGWTYALSGRLKKATRLRGIKNFSARNFGLIPMMVKAWGPLIFIRPNKISEEKDNFFEDLESLKNRLDGIGFSSGMKFMKRITYTLNCNWKVFVDNYLDGGYHVSTAHKDLSVALDASSYRTAVHEWHSIQSVSAVGSEERVCGDAIYAHIFPNLMINRYGPWIDTNVALPLTHNTCMIVFDYFLEEDYIQQKSEEDLQNILDTSFTASDKVQQEDIFLCEGVQRGLESSAYDLGRYAPGVEFADHMFHVKLAELFRRHLKIP